MSEGKLPGLPSVNASRANRRRQMATGRASINGLSTKVFLWGLAILVVGGLIYFYRSQLELEEQRAALLAKQRAVAELLGPRLVPLQESIENALTELSGEQLEEHIEPGVAWEELFEKPGLYLRLRLEDTKDKKKMRQAANQSLRDGFSSCLFRDTRAVQMNQGKACERSSECEPGELCNEFQVCRRPSSPFNMRLLYRALTVLSDEWLDEVKGAKNDLALVVYDRGLDAVTEVDIPVAIDVHQRAQYFAVVLDEDPPEGLPEPLAEDAFESAEERVQRVAHRARVGIWELPSGKRLAQVAAEASGALRDVGRHMQRGGAEAAAARARQANSCGLALEVRGRLLPAEPQQEVGDDETAAE